MEKTFSHVTVFAEGLVSALQLQSGDCAIDCTAGGGGHTANVIDATAPSGRVIAIDRDPLAVSALSARFAPLVTEGRVVIRHGAFSHIKQYAQDAGLTGQVQGICADLGFSSPQIDTAARGFAFSHEGPLDMRMDPSSGGATAADWVNERSEAELEQVFRDFGEEPKARAMARAIVRERANKPFTTTKQLADLAGRSLRYATKSRTHPATRIFQALRIAVNDELGELERLLDDALAILRPGGRIAIISFHSLEDRIVKTKFRAWAGGGGQDDLPRDVPITALEMDRRKGAVARIIKPFPVSPDAAEVAANPRSRSARLRVIEKTNSKEERI